MSKQLSIKIILASIFMLSLSIRGLYLTALIDNDSSLKFSKGADTGHYVHLAKNLAHHGRYAQDSLKSRYIAFLRTPGYPAYYAVFEYFGLAPKYVLVSQAIIGAIIPVMAALLVYLVTGNRLAMMVAGLLCGFSATSILMTGKVQVDLFLGFLFIGGFFCLYLGLYTGRLLLSSISGALFGFSALVKPTVFLWPFCSVIVYYLLANSLKKPVTKKQLVVFVLIQVVIIGSWCQRNYLREGVFTLASIGVHTLRIYLAAEVDLDSRNVTGKFSIGDIKVYQNKIRSRINADLRSGKPIREINQWLMDESREIIGANPNRTYQFFVLNIVEKWKGPKPWWVYDEEIPKESLAYRITPKIISIYTLLTKACLAFVTCFSLLSIIPPIYKKIGKKTDQMYSYWALLTAFVYFSGLSGFTFWTGPRIIFPVQFALFCAFVIGVFISLKILSEGKKIYSNSY